MYLRQSAIVLLAAFACLNVNAFIQTSLSKRSFITSQQHKTQFAVLFGESETPATEAQEEIADAAPVAEIPEGGGEEEAPPTEEIAEAAPVAEISEEAVPATADGEEPKLTVERERFTLFVGNLPFTSTVNDLRDLFSTAGAVKFVNLPRQRDNAKQTRGFAFVDMETKEDAENAMAKLNGVDVGGRLIRVAESLPKDQAKKEPKKFDVGVKKLYVGNLPFETSQSEIKEFFAGYGDISDVYMPKNPDGSPRGFAFIALKEEDAQRCIDETNGVDFQGRPLVVSEPLPPGKKAPRRNQNDNRTKLYVGNLSFYTVAETLAELFEEFGTVHDCYLPEDPATGSSRGFGFVTMDKENAQAAIDETDGCELDGRIIRVNEALPRGAVKPTFDDDDDGDNGDEFDGVDI